MASMRPGLPRGRPRWQGTLTLLLFLVVTTARAEPLDVAVSILPQKYFVERVGGDAVRVQVMVKPGQSHETYEPTPQQVAALARARAYFRIGSPFEDLVLPRALAAHPGLLTVDTRAGIALRTAPAHGHDHEDGRKDGRTRAGQKPQASSSASAPDTHIWTSPRLVKIQAATIRDALVALDPARSADFAAGYAGFAADLDALDTEIRALLEGKRGRAFMVFHPAWGYFAEDYGLRQIAIEAEGKEPGPRTLARIIDTAKAEGVRVVFVQKQFGRTTAEAVARAVGGEVVVVDPLAEDFLASTRTMASALARALQ
jgi:zinc transport system substrate-binding protein